MGIRGYKMILNTHVVGKLYLCTRTCKNQTVMYYEDKIIFEMNMISKATYTNALLIGCNSSLYHVYSCD